MSRKQEDPDYKKGFDGNGKPVSNYAKKLQKRADLPTPPLDLTQTAEEKFSDQYIEPQNNYYHPVFKQHVENPGAFQIISLATTAYKGAAEILYAGPIYLPSPAHVNIAKNFYCFMTAHWSPVSARWTMTRHIGDEKMFETGHEKKFQINLPPDITAEEIFESLKAWTIKAHEWGQKNYAGEAYSKMGLCRDKVGMFVSERKTRDDMARLLMKRLKPSNGTGSDIPWTFKEPS